MKTLPAADSHTDIDINEIFKRIPHRPPFLLVDRCEDYRPHESIVGIKCVTINEPFFVGHFPHYPVMPGVLIVEAMAQSGAILMSKSLDIQPECKTVRPGDELRMNVEVTRRRGDVFKFKGRATVRDKVAADVEFAAMVVETL